MIGMNLYGVVIEATNIEPIIKASYLVNLLVLVFSKKLLKAWISSRLLTMAGVAAAKLIKPRITTARNMAKKLPLMSKSWKSLLCIEFIFYYQSLKIIIKLSVKSWINYVVPNYRTKSHMGYLLIKRLLDFPLFDNVITGALSLGCMSI